MSFLFSTSKKAIGIVLILSVVLIWVLSSEFIQFVFKGLEFNKPLFLTYTNTNMFALYLLGFLCIPKWRNLVYKTRIWKRLFHKSNDDNQLSEESSQVAEENDSAENVEELSPIDNQSQQETKKVHYTLWQVMRASFFMCPLWFSANVAFNYALAHTSVASNSILSNTSSLFTFILCFLFGIDSFSFLRLGSVLTAIGGVVLVALSDANEGTDTLFGNMLTLISAFMYGVYTSFMKKNIPDDSDISVPMFFGFVGLFNVILAWPLFFLVHFTGIEPFEFPHWKAFLSVMLNGLIGTGLSDVLWALSVVLTSPTTATVGLALTIPTAILADIIFHGHLQRLTVKYVFGAALVLIAFIITNVSYVLPPKVKKYDSPECIEKGTRKIRELLCCKKTSSEKHEILTDIELESKILTDIEVEFESAGSEE